MYFNAEIEMSCDMDVEFRVQPSHCSHTLDEDGMSAVTLWIAGDFEKLSGRRLLLGALKRVVSIICSLSYFLWGTEC